MKCSNHSLFVSLEMVDSLILIFYCRKTLETNVRTSCKRNKKRTIIINISSIWYNVCRTLGNDKKLTYEYMKTIKCIGVLTSGGDASGMNAAIRAVTRSAICNGFKVKGIYRGYEGLINGEVKELTTQDVSSVIQRGGTMLKTARSAEFQTVEGRKKAYDTMQREGIDALVIIGGNGSITGARIFAEEYDVPCIGLPGTIDNDLYGTDFTIGYDTALNTIVECVDKIRDTATSHERLFFVEVMGRDAGFLALNGAIAAGAEAAIIPEFSTEVDQLEEFIEHGFRKSKSSSIVLVAESELTGGANALCRTCEERISAIRCACNDIRTFATWRTPHSA